MSPEMVTHGVLVRTESSSVGAVMSLQRFTAFRGFMALLRDGNHVLARGNKDTIFQVGWTDGRCTKCASIHEWSKTGFHHWLRTLKLLPSPLAVLEGTNVS